jgi:hypothetical protein
MNLTDELTKQIVDRYFRATRQKSQESRALGQSLPSARDHLNRMPPIMRRPSTNKGEGSPSACSIPPTERLRPVAEDDKARRRHAGFGWDQQRGVPFGSILCPVEIINGTSLVFVEACHSVRRRNSPELLTYGASRVSPHLQLCPAETPTGTSACNTTLYCSQGRSVHTLCPMEMLTGTSLCIVPKVSWHNSVRRR